MAKEVAEYVAFICSIDDELIVEISTPDQLDIEYVTSDALIS